MGEINLKSEMDFFLARIRSGAVVIATLKIVVLGEHTGKVTL
jgi:hypothetical protein